jgi:hypothetical protein
MPLRSRSLLDGLQAHVLENSGRTLQAIRRRADRGGDDQFEEVILYVPPARAARQRPRSVSLGDW